MTTTPAAAQHASIRMRLQAVALTLRVSAESARLQIFAGQIDPPSTPYERASAWASMASNEFGRSVGAFAAVAPAAQTVAVAALLDATAGRWHDEVHVDNPECPSCGEPGGCDHPTEDLYHDRCDEVFLDPPGPHKDRAGRCRCFDLELAIAGTADPDPVLADEIRGELAGHETGLGPIPPHVAYAVGILTAARLASSDWSCAGVETSITDVLDEWAGCEVNRGKEHTPTPGEVSAVFDKVDGALADLGIVLDTFRSRRAPRIIRRKDTTTS